MPLLQQHLDASDGKFDVIKVNIDRHSEIASALEVNKKIKKVDLHCFNRYHQYPKYS